MKACTKNHPHFCNTLRCPVCVRRFWKWAENHTGASRTAAFGTALSFYEAAALKP